MRLHLILDLSKQGDDARSKPGDEVMEEFENEISSIELDVAGTVYSVDVRGIGRTANDANASYKLRNTGRNTT